MKIIQEKIMPSKAYVIIYNGTDFLYGIGGMVGNHPRPGNHLPGGSFDSKKDSTLEDTAVRECLEEAGITVSKASLGAQISATGINAAVFYKVQMDISTLAKKTGLTGLSTDSPFTEMKIGKISDAKSGALFNATDQTDWFQAGVKAAFP
jgi:ADP-ribose pyrophosphatase YjhB (NUDIX family)